MIIIPHDIGTYLCSSQTGDGDYVVCPEDGECSCPDFIGQIERDHPQPGCVHLDAVRAYLAPKREPVKTIPFLFA